jgi:hypothetical protein
MNNRSHFHRGSNPTFNCGVCGRRTRAVENTDAELCPECWELSGWDNHHNDNAEAPTAAELAGYEKLVASAVKRGSDGAKMRRQFSFIWQK